ncbi:MAG: hypothetical protein COB53_03350 [Elusimicrobia bacterium]|nr:MAG: hypothetical protein COB53_03350 [Elusimicrobiota bacterium]
MNAGLCLPLFALAFGGSRNPWVFTAFALLLWGAAASRRRLPKIPVAPLWGAWLAWSAISAGVSAEPWRGLSDLAYRAAAIGIFVLALDSNREDRKAWRIFLPVAILILEAAAFFINVPSYPHVGVLYPYYNYTAAAAAVGVSFGFALVFSKEESERNLGVACTIVSWVFLAWTGSRGGLVAASAGTMVVLIGSGRKMIAVVLAAGGLMAVVGLFAAGSPLLKLERATANLRPQLWKAAVAVASDSPILGEGPGQFDRGFLRHNFPAPQDKTLTRYGRVSKHAHSELLQEAAEIGWPGVLLLLIALAATFARGCRQKNPELGALGAIAALGAHGVFDNVLSLPALEWLFFSFLGAANSSEETTEAPWPGAWIAAGVLLSIVSWWPKWLVSSALSEGSQPALLQAVSIAPKDPLLWENLARTRLRDKDPRRAMQALVIASQLHPTEAVYPLMIAQLARNARQWNAVLRITQRVITLEPSAPQPRLLRAQAFLELGRPLQARAELEVFNRIAKPLPSIRKLKPGVRFVLGHEAGLRRALEKRLKN